MYFFRTKNKTYITLYYNLSQNAFKFDSSLTK